MDTKANEAVTTTSKGRSKLVRPLLAAAVILGVAILGVYFLNASKAAGPFVSKEVEKGTLTAPAIAVTDATASGGQAVKFAKDNGPPPPPPCNFTDLTDCSYGSHAQQKFDIYPATGGRTGAAIILVHGGAWTEGDKAPFTQRAQEFAASGFTVFNANYRLSTPTFATFPEAVEDIEAIAAYVKAYGSNYRAMPTDIHMVGGSAGGHLTMLASLRMNKVTPNAIKSVSSLSGPTDFYTMRSNNGNLSQFLGCDVMTTCTDAILREASPRAQVSPTSCSSIYVMHSKLELIPVSQAQTIYDDLIADGCGAKINLLNGADHAFTYMDTVYASIVQWINTH